MEQRTGSECPLTRAGTIHREWADPLSLERFQPPPKGLETRALNWSAWPCRLDWFEKKRRSIQRCARRTTRHYLQKSERIILLT